MTRLDPVLVEYIFRDCLFSEDEDKSHRVPGAGIMRTAGFHPGRLEEHRAEIEALLDELPDSFKAGEGDSFLNACLDKHGAQWTGEHLTVDLLVSLGGAIGRVRLDPRAKWSDRHANLPYFVIKA